MSASRVTAEPAGLAELVDAELRRDAVNVPSYGGVVFDRGTLLRFARKVLVFGCAQERARIVRRLRVEGWHAATCQTQQVAGLSDKPCTCGLEADLELQAEHPL